MDFGVFAAWKGAERGTLDGLPPIAVGSGGAFPFLSPLDFPVNVCSPELGPKSCVCHTGWRQESPAGLAWQVWTVLNSAVAGGQRDVASRMVFRLLRPLPGWAF